MRSCKHLQTMRVALHSLSDYYNVPLNIVITSKSFLHAMLKYEPWLFKTKICATKTWFKPVNISLSTSLEVEQRSICDGAEDSNSTLQLQCTQKKTIYSADWHLHNQIQSSLSTLTQKGHFQLFLHPRKDRIRHSCKPSKQISYSLISETVNALISGPQSNKVWSKN